MTPIFDHQRTPEAYCGKCGAHFNSVEFANRRRNSVCARCGEPIE